MLLIFVEKTVKGCRREAQGFRDEGSEIGGKSRHAGNVGLKGGLKFGKILGVRPLVWRKQVMVERRCRFRQRMGSGEIDLLPPIRLQSCNLVTELTVTWIDRSTSTLVILYEKSECYLGN